ncbi:MAG: hypothetical protein ACJ8AG_27335 [Ktedonobacteraceae bacterium]
MRYRSFRTDISSSQHNGNFPRVLAIIPEQLDLGKDLLQRLKQALSSLLVGVMGTAHRDMALAAADG